MSGKKEITDLEDQLSNLSAHELYAVIATLTKWTKRIDNTLKTAKNVWANQVDAGTTEDLRFNNKTVGTISISKGSEGHYVVNDPRKYAAILRQIQWTLDDGRDAWYETIMPCDEACESDFLEKLIRAHDGEIPQGVEYKNGRSAVVSVKLDRSYNSDPLELNGIINPATLEIEEGKNE